MNRRRMQDANLPAKSSLPICRNQWHKVQITALKWGNYKWSKSWTMRFTNTATPLYEGDKLIHKFFTIIKNKGSWNCSACHQALHYSFIHSLYFPYIYIQVEYQGCGNCQSCCNNMWQSYKCQMFQYNYNTMIT